MVHLAYVSVARSNPLTIPADGDYHLITFDHLGVDSLADRESLPSVGAMPTAAINFISGGFGVLVPYHVHWTGPTKAVAPITDRAVALWVGPPGTYDPAAPVYAFESDEISVKAQADDHQTGAAMITHVNTGDEMLMFVKHGASAPLSVHVACAMWGPTGNLL